VIPLLTWDAPGPYRVAFSTREGGVSDGPFRSLNLGLLTGDEPQHVLENRRLLAQACGADPERLAMIWQQHGSRIVRASARSSPTAGAPLEQADGLWTDEPGQPVSVLTADCLPIALCRTRGTPAVAAIHAGWRGLLAGIVEAAAGALGGGRLAAAIGPGIGPCCYEVGDDVARPFRARFGNGVLKSGRLDLWLGAERLLKAAGCREVHRTELCTACDGERFFSHRRDQGRTGRQGMIAYVVER
jgi:YfiH family protein